MREESISLYRDIKQLLDQKMLGAALDKMADVQSKYNYEIGEIGNTYNYMKSYMLDATNDAGRHALHTQLLTQAYELNELLLRESLRKNDPSLYYERLRTSEKLGAVTFAALQQELQQYAENIALAKLIGDSHVIELNKRHKETYLKLFNKIWVSSPLSKTEAAELETLLLSENIPENDRAMAVSALLLALMSLFDARKFLLLMSLCSAPNIRVSGTSCVALLLAAQKHDDLLGYYPEIMKRISLWEDDAELKSTLNTVQIQLLKTLETKDIDRKFNQEIIPELMKEQAKLNKKFGINIIDEKSINEGNPEWGQFDENSEISKRIKEISELQEEGADIYMGTFSKLKSFPFFREIANWFYPFDKNNADLNAEFTDLGKSDNSVLDLILQSKTFCDSDKYSFCFTVAHIPEAQRGVMTQQIKEQSESMEMMKQALNEHTGKMDISNLYIQNLYRFYNLYDRKAEFENPFEHIAQIIDIKSLRTLTDSGDSELKIAEYLFQKSFFELASTQFENYLRNHADAPVEVYQKAGFSAQRMGRYDKAIEFYLRADSEKSNDIWVISRIAYCFLMKNDVDEALRYYNLIDLLSPSTANTLQISKCLIRKKDFSKALEYLFQSHLGNPDDMSTVRILAWCLMETQSKEEAAKYYGLLEQSARDMLSANDLVNIGHCHWINANPRRAFDKYLLAAQKDGAKRIVQTLEEDSYLLLKNGIDRTSVDIMKDMVSTTTNK